MARLLDPFHHHQELSQSRSLQQELAPPPGREPSEAMLLRLNWPVQDQHQHQRPGKQPSAYRSLQGRVHWYQMPAEALPRSTLLLREQKQRLQRRGCFAERWSAR